MARYRCPPTVPVLNVNRGPNYTEIQRLIRHADARADAAWTAAEAAPPSRATAARDRARRLDRDALVPRLAWDTTARAAALTRLRAETIDWLEDGEAVAVVVDKGKGDGPEAREVAFSRTTTPRLRRFLLARAGPAGDVVPPGYVLEGQNPGQPASVDTLERVVHELALEAGVQRLLPGRDGPRRRFLVTLTSIRSAAEEYAIRQGIPESIAAKQAGHTVPVSRRHYQRPRAEDAIAVARARAI